MTRCHFIQTGLKVDPDLLKLFTMCIFSGKVYFLFTLLLWRIYFVLQVELSSEEWQCKTDLLRLNTSAFCVLTIICWFNLKMNVHCFVSILVVLTLLWGRKVWTQLMSVGYVFHKIAYSGQGYTFFVGIVVLLYVSISLLGPVR